ncbi:hypothetical protein MVEN_00687900 [Mycena venus]|uniref:DUF6534 domain-containing protein n=1 Tax=Mycena venus TaxID=2733690 RepID=A0A8H6YEG9_9AGAR|nr:hypothetical protein MVEN_00687900 [Mycena venus]
MGKFDQTIGFMLLAVIMNTYLTGIIMSQFFSYWSSSHKDPRWIRCLVAFLFIINATQACAVVYLSWFYCVTNFTNPQIVGTDLWPYPFTALTTAVLATTNQMFQSWRIYKLTRNKIFVAFLVAGSLAACGMGIAGAIGMFLHVHGPAKLVALRPIVEGKLLLLCCVDVIIAVHLSLIFSRSKTSFARTDRVLNVLIRNAVQSGSFTAIFALGTVLSFRLSSDTSMLVLFSLPIGRIYTHTMMDQLVSREELTAILQRTTSSMASNSNQTSGEQSNGCTYAGRLHQLRPVPFFA